MILSTGMATWDEIDEAIYACLAAGNDRIIILNCASAYPTKPEETNLLGIQAMQNLGYHVGLSDHTLGYTADIMAVTMGACLIEKHIKFNNFTKSPDAAFSLPVYHVDTNDHSVTFRDMVKAIREAEAMMESYMPQETSMWRYRRSLYTVARVREGEPFTETNVKSIRPANGLSPKYLDQILNSKARININYGTPLSWEIIEDKGAL
jgi:sialic acid synthase SpsE